jgi:UDP-N-acetylmuramate--alanine ligase
LELGLSLEQIKKGLISFVGTKRRFEYIGKTENGAYIYDDYAHHPTEIKKTLQAFKQKFPKKKIICIFQPHTYSRTKSLFEQFISSFNDADELILTDIYSSLREKVDQSISSKLLAYEISKIRLNVKYIAKLQDVVKYLDQKRFDENFVIVTMGAGDVYTISLNIKS